MSFCLACHTQHGPDEPCAVEKTRPVEKARSPFELWAKIKKTSKYYHQGLEDPTNSKSKPRSFQVESIIVEQCDSYDFRFNGNAYRRDDLHLFIRSGDKLKKI